LIRAEAITKLFHDKKRGEIVAVNKLSFACKSGMILGVLGLNGAGKTTALRILATLLKPSSGTAFINNIDVVKYPDKAKAQIGFISSDTGLYRRLTPREIVGYFGELYGISRQESAIRLKEYSEILGMDDFLDTKVDKLSTGQKQKVSITRTMLHNPPILIMDEPTAGLDIVASAHIVELIRRAKSQNRAIIFSTHIMHEAQRLCDEILIIHNGMATRNGTIEKLRMETGIEDLDQIFLDSVGDLD